ncbi:MAG: CPBP family glutamic-type intramembrane protease [Thermus sp.]|uniref:CPBP family intramembrane metalloprotease n=1 Tax=Thermus brevis TaxID=2862456 RepID=A0ABS6ZVN7_9DEIN|nr:CPBP family glutamic-type intramembrane protease [Thermus brevis]MBW6394119.1 CPBP family intramembrane metalloprotease [Thermus brevis]
MSALYWTLGLSWVAFPAFYLLGGRVGSPAYLAFGFLYMWIPGLVALSFARKEGVHLPLALRPNRYWLFAWLFPVALTLLSIPLSLPFGAWKGWEALRQTVPQEAAQAIPETLSALFPLVLILSALVAGATVNLLAALGEELLWRGYLWERLKERGFWPASLEIGFWWGLWHAPLILAGHNYPREPLLGVPMMILFTLALTPGLLWVREKAGSVLAAALFHGTLNAIAGLSLLLVEHTHDLLIGVVGLPGLFLLSLFNLWLRRRV